MPTIIHDPAAGATLKVQYSVGEYGIDTVTWPTDEWFVFDGSLVVGVDPKYWKPGTTRGQPVEMSAAEKTAKDAEMATAAEDVALGPVNGTAGPDLLRAVLLVMLDELNSHALKINEILDAVDGAANLTALKTAVAAITDYPQRSIAQLKAALRAKMS